MSFHIIDGDAPGLGSHRAARIAALGCALVVITPAMLLASFGIILLAQSVDPKAGSAAEALSVSDRSVALVVMGVLAASLFAVSRKLLLGKRRLVLFLRHFGSMGPLTTMSRAATAGPGMGFGIRIVTLADQWRPELTPKDAMLDVTDQDELDAAVKRVRRLSRRLLGPTSVFMRVDNPIWRNVVLRLVTETDAVVIDVTTPGESLLWEIETVGPRVRRRWVLVGELERLQQLAQVVPGDPTPDGRLAELLDGETIVSYRVRQKVEPFQRALRARYRLVTRPDFEYVPAQPVTDRPTGGPAVGAPWPPPPGPYQLDGPPSPWWSGRTFGLPATGSGSLVSLRTRIGARGIDVAILLGLMMLLVGAEAAVRAAVGIDEPENPDALRSVVGFLTLAIVVAFDPLSTALFGSTAGKRIIGLAVITTSDHQRASAWRLTARALIALMCWMLIVPGVLDLIAGWHDPLRQTWHDRAAGTIVVRS